MLDIFPSLGRPGYDGSQSLPLGAARDREAASRPPLPPAMLRELSERQSPQVTTGAVPLPRYGKRMHYSQNLERDYRGTSCLCW